ncbi:MAG: polysaccharide biosynthesis/export family protein [Hyphomonadaceae bacterium]
MNIQKWAMIVSSTLLFALIAGCATATTRTEAPAPTAQVQTVATTNAAYSLGNGDRLRVTVFGEEDMSGEFLVDSTGQVSIPLVGEVSAAGRTVRDFQRELETRLVDGGILLNPRVSAEVINFRPFYILGEVGLPGEYPYTDSLTVMNAVATAQGFSYRANKKVIGILGLGETEEQLVRLTPDLKVRPGDTIRIRERVF